MADTKKRSLLELRVIDLRCELEKRGLDKTGVRAVLLKRLTKAVKDEGHNPDTFTVDISGNDQKSPNKRVSRSDSVVENDEPPIDVSVDELLVQDEINEEDESAEKGEEETEPEAKPEEEANGSDIKVNRKRENDEKVETIAAKKPCVKKAPAQENAKKQVDQSNTDAEDSINLDIGDDELLNDETDSTSRAKKDQGATPQPQQEEPPATDGDAPQSGGDAAPLSDRCEDESAADAKKTSEPDETEKDKDKKGEKEDNDTSDSKNTEGNVGSNTTSSSGSGQARNLWVSGLSGDTRAKDLKQLCSKHGKVIGAKVVTNARTPGSRCYGYVTMASSQDAENCIKNLHRTELHGRMISVEKAKSESSASTASTAVPRDSSSSSWRRSAAVRSYRRPGAHRRSASGGAAAEGKENKEENGAGKEGAEHTGEEGGESGDKEKGDTEGVDGASRDDEDRKTDEKRKHSSDRASRPGDRHIDRSRRERSRGRRNSPRDVLSFSKIWKERDSARSRERVRAVREEERRRRAAEEDLRERERRQRNEKHRLALEREKLRQEREKIEREKNELLRLERERHKLEREKLELERLELKRAQIRLEEERSRGLKRSYEPAYERSARAERKAVSPPTYDRHKRSVPSAATSVSTGSSRQFEPPPPPRFELPTPAYERAPADKRERDYKRDYTRHISSSASVKYPSNGTASDDSRQPLPPGTRPKEQSRYVESERSGGRGEAARASAGREGRGYRGTSPGKGDSARSWGAAAPRYADAPAQSKGEYGERSSWHSNSKYNSSRHPPPSSAPPVSSTHQTWGKPGGESWASSSGSDARYGSSGAAAGAAYDSRYATPYQPPPPGAAPYVADTRYAPPASARDYRKY